MKKVLIADKLPARCTNILKEAGLEVDYRPGLREDELKQAARDVHGIICRSGARLTEAVFDAAENLEAVCRAGVGVDNIDVRAASRRGVVVMNTPGGNTISTAEHAFALMLALARNIGPAYGSMRQGRWEKKKFVGSQLFGATLGIVGLGRIGREVARRAIGFGMNVLAYDPFVSRETAEKIGARLVEELEELLRQCDYLTVHVPDSERTRGMIGAEQIAAMKDGACIINCARGTIVDQEAAVAAVKNGKLGGLALDVFPKEPPDDYEFTRHDRILTTPHLGASTEAAQMAVAIEAAEQLVQALKYGRYPNALNVALASPEEMKLLEPYCELAARLGELAAQLNPGRYRSLQVACSGELARDNVRPIVNYGAMGVLRRSAGDRVNLISAPYLAEERGLRLTSSSTVGVDAGFTDLVELRLATESRTTEVAGTVFGRKHQRVVRIDGFHIEIIPEGHVLIIFGSDVPGFIGKVGLTLAEAGLNIARMGFGRRSLGGRAMLALNVDSQPDREVVARIGELEVVEHVVAVEL